MTDPLTMRDCLTWVGTVRLLEIRMTNPRRNKGSLGDVSIFCPVNVLAVGYASGGTKHKMARITPVGGRGEWWVDVTRLHRKPKPRPPEET